MFTVRADEHGISYVPTSDGRDAGQSAAPAFKTRANEPEYALLPPSNGTSVNQWGKPIQLIDGNDPLAGKSLRINHSAAISSNPDRHKQHGFFFTADNCIGCHACEAACSEKNDLPPHLSFRSVGYVEGGTYPDFQRINISMACNHCDDPVCLKGCPTRAYTKFAEYGAVLQDPDICFGCGYCTWVCPYNAPQLDPIKGQVSKCNMCVDRLEVGLKPACVAACLGGALDFGVIETRPQDREQAKLAIPGFPDPGITHPNIRFQQTRDLPREMTRPDTMPLRYVRKAGEDSHSPEAAERPMKREWNLKKLRSREDPLVIFTLVSQGVIGAFLWLFLGPRFGLSELAHGSHPLAHTLALFAMLGAQTFALALSTVHLGKPHRFYRAFNNLRYSPVSREVASIAVFYNALGGYGLLTAFPALFDFLPAGYPETLAAICGWLATLAGPIAIFAMYCIYRIKARPYWDHWQVATAFYGNVLTLGSVGVGVFFAVALVAQGLPLARLMRWLALAMMMGLLLEVVGLRAHARALVRRGGEAAAAALEQRTTFGKTYHARNAALAFSMVMVTGLAIAGIDGAAGWVLWAMAALLIVATAVVGRALFYVIVIPTTMPGAFFWRNKGFEAHARETGLAKMPQVGVLPHAH